jgi:hypothetical protein
MAGESVGLWLSDLPGCKEHFLIAAESYRFIFGLSSIIFLESLCLTRQCHSCNTKLKEESDMESLVIFVAGAMVGGFLGVVLMALLVVGKD